MSYTMDDMKRINGNVSEDVGMVEAMSTEMLMEVKRAAEVINEFAELKRVMTFSAATEVKDAMIAIRHIHSCVFELVQLYDAKPIMAKPVQDAYKEINDILVKAIEKGRVLLDLARYEEPTK